MSWRIGSAWDKQGLARHPERKSLPVIVAIIFIVCQIYICSTCFLVGRQCRLLKEYLKNEAKYKNDLKTTFDPTTPEYQYLVTDTDLGT